MVLFGYNSHAILFLYCPTEGPVDKIGDCGESSRVEMEGAGVSVMGTAEKEFEILRLPSNPGQLDAFLVFLEAAKLFQKQKLIKLWKMVEACPFIEVITSGGDSQLCCLELSQTL